MTIQKKTVTAQVTDQLRQRIVSGHYSGGDQLRQEHLAQEFGVSRIPVREALHHLSSEGLVTLVSHKGAVVSTISIDEIRELYQLRTRIEPWLMGLAIANISKADIAAAQAGLDAMVAAEDLTDSDWFELNWVFHSALCIPARRPATMLLLQKIHQQIKRYTQLVVTFSRDQTASNREHALLLKLWKAHEVDKAIVLLERHISNTGNFLIEELSKLRHLSAPASPQAEPVAKPAMSGSRRRKSDPVARRA